MHSVDVETGKQIDLTPFKDVQAQVVGVSHKRPNVVLVGLNDRAPEWHDLYEIDVGTGERKLVEKNDRRVRRLRADLDLAAAHRGEDAAERRRTDVPPNGARAGRSFSSTARKTASPPRRSPSKAMAARRC